MTSYRSWLLLLFVVCCCLLLNFKPLQVAITASTYPTSGHACFESFAKEEEQEETPGWCRGCW